jgi:tRNA pseudouridine55 synthase
MNLTEGILPCNKPVGKTSFSLITALRKVTKIKKIGHAGTLDPFASGVMILLIGRTFTRQAETFLNQEKEYEATLRLGIETTTYDPEGAVIAKNDRIPPLIEIENALTHFQGTIHQLPPMFSAKKIGGKKLYEFARKGLIIERKHAIVTLKTELLDYCYPFLKLKITCSKGTYIRSLAHDLGAILGIGGHLSALIRTRSGSYHLKDCVEGTQFYDLSGSRLSS